MRAQLITATAMLIVTASAWADGFRSRSGLVLPFVPMSGDGACNGDARDSGERRSCVNLLPSLLAPPPRVGEASPAPVLVGVRVDMMGDGRGQASCSFLASCVG